MKTLALWKKYHAIPAYQHYLRLFKKYAILDISDEQFDELDELDWVDIWNISDERKNYQNNILPEVQKDIRELIKENPEFAKIQRIEYIEISIATIEKQLFNYKNNMEYFERKGYSRLERAFLEGCIWGKNRIDKKQYILDRFKKELMWLKSDDTGSDNRVTDLQIEQAHHYPFRQLVSLNSRGFMKCCFHQEKTASMSLNKKNNTLKCFGCGKVCDPIQYVMEVQNKTFPEAVRMLSN